MTITSLSLITNNDAIRFDSTNVALEPPYILKKITGIDAEEITPKFYGFNIEGDKKFYDLGLKPRSIAVLVQLNPRFALGETHKDLRDQLYRMILASRTGQVELVFHQGAHAICRIFGFITKFEAPQFSKTPVVTLTFTCPDPMLRGMNTVEVDPAVLNVDANLELTDGISTAPHGFVMEVEFTSDETTFIIQDTSVDPQWAFQVDPHGTFFAGNTLYISSEFGNKNVYMEDTGVRTYLMDKVHIGSLWPIVFPGLNTFYFDQYSSIDFNYLNYEAAFWGI